MRYGATQPGPLSRLGGMPASKEHDGEAFDAADEGEPAVTADDEAKLAAKQLKELEKAVKAAEKADKAGAVEGATDG